MLSTPPAPSRVSLPSKPFSVSLPAPPTSESLPAVPLALLPGGGGPPVSPTVAVAARVAGRAGGRRAAVLDHDVGGGEIRRHPDRAALHRQRADELRGDAA